MSHNKADNPRCSIIRRTSLKFILRQTSPTEEKVSHNSELSPPISSWSPERLLSSKTIVRVAKNFLEPLFLSKLTAVQKEALCVICTSVTCNIT